jgi:DNA-binding MarR family transcriptional regulator
MTVDPTEQSSWRPLRELQAAMDADLAKLYDERGIAGVRPRFSMALIRLSRRGDQTIRQLADQLGVTHSAMSQTVSAMRRDGLVRTRSGADARTRQVGLTARGRALVPFLEAEWRATEQAVAELEGEIPYPLSDVVRDMAAALARRSFHDRVRDILDRPRT